MNSDTESTSDAITFRGLGFAPGDVLVVTGAASGIGRSTALIGARAGLRVAAWDLAAEALMAVTGEIEHKDGSALAVTVDVTDGTQIADAWSATAALGEPKYFASNAGPTTQVPYTLVQGITAALGSMMNLSQSWLERFGDVAESVVYTSSIAGNITGSTGASEWYSASKAGVAGYMRHQAVRHRGRPRFNAVAPGLILTPRTAKKDRAYVENVEARIPLGRRGRPEEVAYAILFLLSPAASYVNGALLTVDGGRTVAVD